MSAVTGTGGRRGLYDLRLVARQVRYEQLGFWLNPVAAVFTIVFSVVFLVLLAATAGNSRIAFLGNIRAVRYYVPSFAAYGVMSACFNMLTISIVVRREMGLLKRVRLSPLPTWVMLAAIFINALIIWQSRSNSATLTGWSPITRRAESPRPMPITMRPPETSWSVA